MAVLGGVEVIGTLTSKNGKFPVVMADDVGFDDGSTLVEIVNDLKGNNVNSISAFKQAIDNKKRTGMVEYPFQEINKSNTMELRLVRSGDMVFCTIIAFLEVPMAGKFDLDDIKIPEGYHPVNQAREYYTGGYWNIDVLGSIHLYSSSPEAADRSVSLCWLTDDTMPEEG